MAWHAFQRKIRICIRNNWRVLAVCCFVALLIFLIYRRKFQATEKRKIGAGKKEKLEIQSVPPSVKVEVEVHMESRCPDTTNFFHHQLWPVSTELKDIIHLKIIPFGKAHCVSQPNDDFACRCQHLEKECVLNQLMNCVIDKLKTPDRYLSIIGCLQGHDMNKADQCLREAGLTSAPYVECANGKKGRQLHAQAGEKTKALNPSMYFVPWVLINGKREERGFSSLKNLVCEKYTGTPKPEACPGK